MKFLTEETSLEKDKESDKNPYQKDNEKVKQACEIPMTKYYTRSKTNLLKANPKEVGYEDKKKLLRF